MSTRRKFKNRVFTKIDKYAFSDVRRDNRLSAQATLVLESMVKLADHRSRIYSGHISDLHDYTGISRSTLRKILKDLEDKFLIVRLPAPTGDRQTHWSVATVYDQFVVPPDTENLGNADQSVTSSRPSGDKAVKQSLHSTSDSAQFGGLEALEVLGERYPEGSISTHMLRAEYEALSASWPHISDHLDEAISRLGLDPAKEWWSAATSLGLGEEVIGALRRVGDSFEPF